MKFNIICVSSRSVDEWHLPIEATAEMREGQVYVNGHFFGKFGSLGEGLDGLAMVIQVLEVAWIYGEDIDLYTDTPATDESGSPRSGTTPEMLREKAKEAIARRRMSVFRAAFVSHFRYHFPPVEKA